MFAFLEVCYCCYYYYCYYYIYYDHFIFYFFFYVCKDDMKMIIRIILWWALSIWCEFSRESNFKARKAKLTFCPEEPRLEQKELQKRKKM